MTYALIGDVHGCTAELNELLVLLNDRGISNYIFVGDLVDKGPDSPGTVKRVRELSYTKNVVLVKGNHEEKHERFRKHLAKGTGTHRKMKNWEELQSITDGLSQDDIDWLDTAVLYHQISLPTGDLMVVHGGVPPCIDVLPSVEEIDAASSKRRKFFSQLLRVRYVDSRGRMIMLGEETDDDAYWAEIYDGRFGHVYFGHQPFFPDETGYCLGEHTYGYATGIDLGCVFGGKLCAAVISDDGSDVQLVTVQARAKYAEPMF